MKKSNDDFMNPNNDLFGPFNGGKRDFDDEMPLISMMALAMAPKPMGMAWNDEPIEAFLKYKGYRIIDRKNEAGDDICVAVKNDADSIPGEVTNVLDVFSHELQMSIINFLIKNNL